MRTKGDCKALFLAYLDEATKKGIAIPLIKNADYILGQPKYGYIKMQARIQVGTRYLKGSAKILQTYANQLYNTRAGDLEWTTNAAHRVEIVVPTYVKYNNLQENANDFIFTIDITSPVIEATGDIVFDIDSDGAFTTSIADVPITSIIPFFNAWESFSSALSILKGLEEAEKVEGEDGQDGGSRREVRLHRSGPAS